MKRIISALLTAVLAASLFAGCNNLQTSKLDLTTANYSILDPIAPAPDESATFDGTAKSYLEKYLKVLLLATQAVHAEIYTFNFDGIGFVSSEDARNFLIPALAKELGEARILDSVSLNTIGIWAAPRDGTYENDIKEIWVNAYENAEDDPEFVVDFQRFDFPIRTLRYVESSTGNFSLKDDTMAPKYDATEPAAITPLTPDSSASGNTIYLSGRLNKTAIVEYPVLNGIDINMQITGTPVDGSVPGGFAGGFQGTVTLDGVSMPLNLDGNGMQIPTGMVTNPSEYYIAFSKISTANPQDKTGYRNIYFIKKDLSSVVGISGLHKNSIYADWFETVRVSKSSFDSSVKTDNEKLTSLYSAVIVTTYGDRKEYNNMVAVLYNMFIGVNQDYLRSNMTKQISSVSKDIRNYSDAINDSSVSRLGENGFYFFPDGRSMVVRLLSYDGSTAVAAIDFSSMVDNGYGGLYRAEYANGAWTLTTLQNTRIK